MCDRGLSPCCAGVKIVPIGLQYDSHSKFRSRVLVSFGEAIVVKETLGDKASPPEQFEHLIDKTSEALKRLMLHIDQPDYEKKTAYFLKNRSIKKDLVEQLKSDQEIILNTPTLSDRAIETTLDKSGSWWSPIFIYGFINHLFPWMIVRWAIKTKVKDPQFIGSLKFALGMLLVPIFYILQTGACLAISGSWMISGIYLLSLPVSVILRD